MNNNIKKRIKLTAAAIGFLLSAAGQVGGEGMASKQAVERPTVVFSTTLGDLTIELYPDEAPVTVKNFLEYVDSGFYNGIIFHRVIPGFVLQGGGFTEEMVQK